MQLKGSHFNILGKIEKTWKRLKRGLAQARPGRQFSGLIQAQPGGQFSSLIRARPGGQISGLIPVAGRARHFRAKNEKTSGKDQKKQIGEYKNKNENYKNEKAWNILNQD